MRRFGWVMVLLLAIGAVTGLAVPAGAAEAECGGRPDFNGDGRDDLAVGVPGKDVNGKSNAGAVEIVYGSASGLTTTGGQVLHEDSSGIGDTAAASDLFGSAVATGDFDGDGRDDLAVGIPQKDVPGKDDAGAVHILYGSASGVSASGDQVIHQDATEIEDVASAFDGFGWAVSACDFDGDGRDDLAVGIPGKQVNGKVAAGALHVFYGSLSGLSASEDDVIHQDTTGVTDASAATDNLGWSLASGDFDGDARNDLAVGIPSKNPNGKDDAGAVHVLYGSAAGVSVSGDHVIHQDISGMTDSAADSDEFGASLAAGNFDGDGRDDLAVGISRKDLPEKKDAGAVHIVYGSASGLSASGDQVMHQDVSGVTDSAVAGDRFGWVVASGDLDDDGRDDLAVGILVKDVPGKENAGAVHALYGSGSGLSASGDQVIHQDVAGIADQAAAEDLFGFAVVSSDFDGDGADDLAVGVPFKTVDDKADAGAVHVLYGASSSGLSGSGDHVIDQDDLVEDLAEADDLFGTTFARGPSSGNLLLFL